MPTLSYLDGASTRAGRARCREKQNAVPEVMVPVPKARVMERSHGNRFRAVYTGLNTSISRRTQLRPLFHPRH